MMRRKPFERLERRLDGGRAQAAVGEGVLAEEDAARGLLQDACSGSSDAPSATTRRIALAPMSTTATGRGGCAGAGTAGAGSGRGSVFLRPIRIPSRAARRLYRRCALRALPQPPPRRVAGSSRGRGRGLHDLARLHLDRHAQRPFQQLGAARRAPELEGGVGGHVALHAQGVAAAARRPGRAPPGGGCGRARRPGAGGRPAPAPCGAPRARARRTPDASGAGGPGGGSGRRWPAPRSRGA